MNDTFIEMKVSQNRKKCDQKAPDSVLFKIDALLVLILY